MNTLPRPTPLVVIILDGWGVSFVEQGNAIMAAPTPVMDSYARHYPSAAIRASGIEVGLPWGEVGNSETGHRNIGAGRIQYQTLSMIDNAIEKGSFFENKILLDAIGHAKTYNSNLHLMGLVSAGGVHGHMNHLIALLKLCAEQKVTQNVYIHMFTDGRDTWQQSALGYLATVEKAMQQYNIGNIASVMGRFYAMDRNNNWDRTEAAYNLLTQGTRQAGAANARMAIQQSYDQGVFDEMIPPTAITRGGEAIGTINNNDAVIFFNFRPDRARQITQAFIQPEAVGFTPKPLSNIYFATMTQYDATFFNPAAFYEERPEAPLARVISDAGLTQLHIAETEKYAHVTYYLNVGYEEPFPGEEHIMIRSSSAKDFSKEPHMQAGAIAEHVVQTIQKQAYDIYFVNFANADMVGHTGDIEAAMAACAFVDQCIGTIEKAATAAGGALLVTADHGNAEEMTNPETGIKEKDHTNNPVPLHFVLPSLKRSTPKSDQEIIAIFSSPIGVLTDVAPTVLDILHIEKPALMTGVSLLNSLR
jgi:2,3-bisphosphoglycerate-independent phosphoglycerate mutase